MEDKVIRNIYEQIFYDFDINISLNNNELIIIFPEIWNSKYIYKLDDKGNIIDRLKDYEY